MHQLTIDKKNQKVKIQDNWRFVTIFLKFIFGINILNAVIFYLVFNQYDDSLKWLWLIFAIINVVLLYLTFIKFSTKNEFAFHEIKGIQRNSLLGLLIELNNGKWRKIFIQSDSKEAQKLINQFNKSI